MLALLGRHVKLRKLFEGLQKMRRYSLLFVVPIVFLLDRLSKVYIKSFIPVNEGIECTPIFSLVHVRNYGGAFSILSSWGYSPLVFTVLPLAIVGVLIFFLIRINLPSLERVALLLIIGGALGNLYDRIAVGYVIDFLDFHYGNLHWPAFNLADASITTGVFLWIFVEMRKRR